METIVITGGDMAVPAGIIAGGGLVAVPTETVYGLAANGLAAAAVERIYAAKNRPETKPISLLVSGMEDAEAFCRDVPDAAYRLAGAFWPGPLTMVLRKRPIVPDIVTAGGGTVGVRCPDHPKTLEIIRLSGVPLAAPSANLSGQPSPKCAQDVIDVFGGKIDCVVDGGECAVGVESTVLDLTGTSPRILRPGALSKADIERVINIEVLE